MSTPLLRVDYDLPRPTESHWWGTVRNTSGWTACPIRSAYHDPHRLGRRLLLSVGHGRDGLRLDPGGATTALGAPAEVEVTPSGTTYRTRGNGWSVRTGGGRIEWSEGDTVTLHGTATCPPCAWSLANIDYALQVFEVSGTVLGRHVQGFVGSDQIHLTEGGRFYEDDPITRGKLLVAMFSFANRFADGTIESGALGIGHDGWRYAFIHRTGEPAVATTDVDCDIIRDDGYWPDRIDVTIAGQPWRWSGDSTGRFTSYGPIDNPQMDGRFQRVGDDRSPIVWFAQGETVPQHGDRPSVA
jgi:hypothetical protein